MEIFIKKFIFIKKIMITFGIITCGIIVCFLIHYFLTQNNLSDSEKKEEVEKLIKSFEEKEVITLYDEIFYVLLKFYSAELTRKSSSRWLRISEFKDKCPNIYKIIPKMLELGLLIPAFPEDKKSAAYVITFDGLKLIEFNSVFLTSISRVKFSILIKYLIVKKFSKKMNISNEILENIKEAHDISTKL